MVARMVTDLDGDATITFPYVEEVIARLKLAVPSHSRRWDPEHRCWWVEARYVERTYDLLASFFGVVEVERPTPEPPPPPTAQPRGLAAHYATLHLLPSAPAELVESAYRCLAKLTHPDGKPAAEVPAATAAMVRLNLSYQTIRQRSA